MKYLIFLLFFFSFESFAGSSINIIIDAPANSFDPRLAKGIAPEFEKYVKKYEKITKRKIQDITINFGVDEEDQSVIGICYKYQFRRSLRVYREVFIKESYWIFAEENAKEALILHELGHCDLDRKHDERFIKKNNVKIAKSIMYPYNIGSYFYYEKNKNYYYRELREGKRGRKRDIKNRSN